MDATKNQPAKTEAFDQSVNDSAGHKTYNAALYLRVSVADRRKQASDTVAAQRERLLSYLREQPAIKLQGVYEDVNYSGTHFARPGFARMMADIQVGWVDCVIVKDLSRLGRNFNETGHLVERVFPYYQVRFIAVDDGYDSFAADTAENGLILPLKNLLNDLYARDIAQKVKSGIRIKQQRGVFCGSVAPYGYSKKGDSLVVDAKTAPVVRQIFAWLMAGESDHAIAAKLNAQQTMPPYRYRFEQGITNAPQYASARFWHASAIRRIATNPTYTGILVQHRRQTGMADGSACTVIRQTHEALIDSRTFEAVKQRRAARAKNKKTPARAAGESQNLFKNILRCGDCGAHMARRGADYFICATYAYIDKQACTQKRISGSELKELLLTLIHTHVKLISGSEKATPDARQQSAARRTSAASVRHRAALLRKLTRSRRSGVRLRERYIDGALSKREYDILKKDCDVEKTRTQTALAALPDEECSSMAARLSPQKLAAWIKRIYISDSHYVTILFHCGDDMTME